MTNNRKTLESRYSENEIRSCREKKRFKSREEAVLNFLRQKQTKGLLEPLVFLKTYKCEHCGGYHNTKDYDAITLPFQQGRELDKLYAQGKLVKAQNLMEKFKKDQQRA